MTVHTLNREIWVPRPLDEVFGFFSDARNLQAITPPWLDFRVVTKGLIEMNRGARIEYRLKLRGVPVGWLTEIETWDPPNRFVDVQLRGPYRLWHHTHEFSAHEGGTRIRDVVRYALPLGPLGEIVHRLHVRKDVEKVFDYRTEQIQARFGRAPAA